MSADNMLIISKKEKYILEEHNASTGNAYWSEEYDSLGEAVNKANDYMKQNTVEYGLNLNL